MAEPADDVLRAPLVIEYPFSRTLGPVQSAFLTGLRDARILGVRRGDGSVLVPPVEYDPDTAEELHETVEVGPAGTVTTWAWISEPRRDNPLDHGFAWALIRLDGADTALLHAVDTGDESRMRTGLRVRPRWRTEREGQITDIECFEPEGEG